MGGGRVARVDLVHWKCVGCPNHTRTLLRHTHTHTHTHTQVASRALGRRASGLIKSATTISCLGGKKRARIWFVWFVWLYCVVLFVCLFACL
jgi:hypothetical protein